MVLRLELPRTTSMRMRRVSASAGSRDRQDVEQVGEAAVALAQHAERLGRDLAEEPHVAALEYGFSTWATLSVELARLAGEEQAEQVVEVQDVVALPGLLRMASSRSSHWPT